MKETLFIRTTCFHQISFVSFSSFCTFGLQTVKKKKKKDLTIDNVVILNIGLPTTGLEQLFSEHMGTFQGLDSCLDVDLCIRVDGREPPTPSRLHSNIILPGCGIENASPLHQPSWPPFLFLPSQLS